MKARRDIVDVEDIWVLARLDVPSLKLQALSGVTPCGQLPTFRTIIMYLHLHGKGAQETYTRWKIRANLRSCFLRRNGF
jgi:hypothetical protein